MMLQEHCETHMRLAQGYGGRFYGVYPAVVVDIVDPDGQGRVRIRLPWSPDPKQAKYEAWARLATMMAGGERGSWFIPDEQDEVLVIFGAGDPRHPFVVGGLWNGQDAPPEEMDGSGQNNIKKLRSRNGVTITLDDTDGTEKLTLETPGGQVLELKDGPGEIELRDSNGNSLKMNSTGITLQSSGQITLQAGGTADVTASQVNVTAGMAMFSGTVQSQTAICTSVVGTSYTPGAGNIW